MSLRFDLEALGGNKVWEWGYLLARRPGEALFASYKVQGGSMEYSGNNRDLFPIGNNVNT